MTKDPSDAETCLHFGMVEPIGHAHSAMTLPSSTRLSHYEISLFQAHFVTFQKLKYYEISYFLALFVILQELKL